MTNKKHNWVEDDTITFKPKPEKENNPKKEITLIIELKKLINTKSRKFITITELKQIINKYEKK